MKRFHIIPALAALVMLLSASTCTEIGKKTTAQDTTPAAVVPSTESPAPDASTVYFTSKITPEGLVGIYNALGVKASGRVAVKISTGESSKSNHLSPALIKDLVHTVNGTLVECNTAYGGNRSDTESHRKAIKERGYEQIAPVDIMDAEGTIDIPVVDDKWIKYDRVGSHLQNYDFMINLAHFKGHAMGGFGGVLKNQSIGVASSAGKLYIHSAGRSTTSWMSDNQDGFLESMAAAAQAVHNYFKQEGKDIIYINVMNNMSVDCDCDGNPATPRLKDIGILASTDPVALDQACLDLVFNHTDAPGNDAKPLQERINSLHGTHITEYAEQLGLGTRKYNIVNIDESKTLVAYFSATGTTEAIAKELAAVTGAKLCEIKPETAYTAEDLDWTVKTSRSSVEMQNRSSRPAIVKDLKDAGGYDTVYIGFPIWWDTAPTIINTFIETYGFKGKTVVFFATSGGSSLDKANAEFKSLYPEINWKAGKTLNRASRADIKSWVETIFPD